MEFFANNWGTILVGAIVLSIVAAVIVRLVKNKKKGGGCSCSSCSNCASCPMCKNREKKD
ncbi:MAG: FeoB-associated Cys-rich membrane protein [Clostridia bacterium]|nr:FeoB-associated Cys-rich membrane protein [Clostridia bacterium]